MLIFSPSPRPSCPPADTSTRSAFPLLPLPLDSGLFRRAELTLRPLLVLQVPVRRLPVAHEGALEAAAGTGRRVESARTSEGPGRREGCNEEREFCLSFSGVTLSRRECEKGAEAQEREPRRVQDDERGGKCGVVALESSSLEAGAGCEPNKYTFSTLGCASTAGRQGSTTAHGETACGTLAPSSSSSLLLPSRERGTLMRRRRGCC